MNLLEHEGKALLRANGIPIPAGAIWPALPDGASSSGWVIKAQVFQGHRGQRGGIKLAHTREEIGHLVAKMRETTIGGERIGAVYVEERLEQERELYLAALVDRDHGCVRLIAAADGGIDIETVPAERIVNIQIDALVGVRPYQLSLLALRLGLQGGTAATFRDIARRLYLALVQEDAELIEINPLIVTPQGSVVAADAKVTLDDDAVARHTGRQHPMQWQNDSSFMRRMRELGAIGIDTRPHLAASRQARPVGRIAVLCNGAGMTMATFDLVTHLGGLVCGAVELHGALAAGVEHTASVVNGLQLLSPDVVMINGFYQLRGCDTFAEAIVAAVRRPPEWIDPAHVIVRMRGLKSDDAIEILQRAGCRASASLAEASAMAVEAARRISQAKTA